MIVGINGRMRAGKDTLCRMIQEFEPKAQRIAFADKLKQSAAASLGITVEQLEFLKEKIEANYVPLDHLSEGQRGLRMGQIIDTVPPFNVRTFLQRYGTEAHREVFGDSFWVDQALPETDEGGMWIVTDMRFPNEVEAIRARNGLLVQVRNPRTDDVPITHPSEQTISTEFDLVVNNNGTLDDLRKRVQSEVIPGIVRHLDSTGESFRWTAAEQLMHAPYGKRHPDAYYD